MLLIKPLAIRLYGMMMYLRFMEFAIDFNESIGDDNSQLKKLYEEMRAFIPTKQPNQIDTKEIRDVKGFIRKTEAISGARLCRTG